MTGRGRGTKRERGDGGTVNRRGGEKETATE